MKCPDQWNAIASMSTRRSSVGVGVLNNLLYAVSNEFMDQDPPKFSDVH